MTEPECRHDRAIPAWTDDQLKGLSPAEVRAHFPRFEGKCPDCGREMIAYASRYHYMAGDW